MTARARKLLVTVVAALLLPHLGIDGLGIGRLGVDRAEAAPDAGERVRKRLAHGKALFDDLEYRKAIRTVAPVTKDSAATRAQRLQAYELIGLSYLILGEQDLAREAFQDLLAIDPGYQLRDDTGSPKIRDFFDRVKREYVPGYDTNATAELEHAAPRSAIAGRRVELEVTVKKGGGLVKDVVAVYRNRGVLAYTKSVHFRHIRKQLWRAHFKLPASNEPFDLEYYVEARDITGRSLGRVAGPETPLAIPVAAGGMGGTPWYRRWYVIAGGVAAAGIGAVLISTSGESAPNGSLDPGRVTLTP